MKDTIEAFLGRIEKFCSLESDTHEARRYKITMVLISALCIVASFIWGTLYYAILGTNWTMYFTYGFTVVMGGALTVFCSTKRFSVLFYPFLIMILLNPIAMQLSLGGFAASGAVMIWSLLAPLCVLMFQNARRAVYWFVAYVVLLLTAIFLDQQVMYRAIPLSHGVSMLFFGMNIIGPSLTIFFSMMYFVKAFQREHERSERLLLNILPRPIAERLKQKQDIIADGFPEVTILFADIVGFTKLSASISPEELVVMLNRVFSIFDRLSKECGLEKIKTIGDAYMVVGGLPEQRPDHAEAIADMAVGMQREIKRLNEETGLSLRLRIGIHTGPVVAGVIGMQKFIYDLWGDTVNTASRMESHGVEDNIQITESTYERLKDDFVCDERGEIEVKGKGVMRVYLLKGRADGKERCILTQCDNSDERCILPQYDRWEAEER